jgi:hypothetical protein
MVGASVPHDAAVAVLVALTKVCSLKPKIGRKARRQAVKEIRTSPLHPGVRADAIAAIRRSCETCHRCRGV